MMTATHEFELSIPARAENVALVRHALGGFIKEFDAAEDVVANVLLAVTEACTNAVLHAYRHSPNDGPIDVSACVEDRELHVSVRDHGIGIAPRVDSPGLGLGLPVIISVSESVSIRPVDEGGTEVSMRFDLLRPAT